jgi:hypothetical protein
MQGGQIWSEAAFWTGRIGRRQTMRGKVSAKRILLAGASMLAMMAGPSGAGATTFIFTGSEVVFTVPASGLYDITAFGAQGGQSLNTGGLGAEAEGDILLSGGTALTVLAGGAGANGNVGALGYGGGGGGGSFVFEGLATLAAAGGGGGGGGGPFGAPGGPGLATTAGGGGTGSGLGGSGGAGGLGGTGGGFSGGGGGAGVLGGGTSATGSSPGAGAGSITSPGATQVAGGFGGGGGSGFIGAGAGGGFSGGGGGGGFHGSIGGGGGGGSYLASLFTISILTSGVNGGNGYVTIDPVVAPSIPEPSTWALMLIGFAGVGFAGFRRAKRNRAAVAA